MLLSLALLVSASVGCLVRLRIVSMFGVLFLSVVVGSRQFKSARVRQASVASGPSREKENCTCVSSVLACCRSWAQPAVPDTAAIFVVIMVSVKNAVGYGRQRTSLAGRVLEIVA